MHSECRLSCRRVCCIVAAMLVCASGSPGTAQAQDAVPIKRNWFDDPFFNVSHGLSACPAPEGPMLTEAERRDQMHSRLERGTSCWLAGRCKDSNAYRYDKGLQAPVRSALLRVPGMQRASVWVIVQRRWVYLQGCVPDAKMARRLESAARSVADVETVVPDLMIGTRGKPPYAVAPTTTTETSTSGKQ